MQVLKDRSVLLTPRQRAAFILINGKRSLNDVLAATSGMGVTLQELEQLVSLGLVSLVEISGVSLPEAPLPEPNSERSPQERYQAAYPVATQLTAGLGLRGFRLNLAVEAAGSFEKLAELAPKIKQAVGPEKFAALDKALHS